MRWGRLLLFCIGILILFVIVPTVRIILRIPDISVASSAIPLKKRHTRSHDEPNRPNRLLILIVRGLTPQTEWGGYWGAAAFPTRAGRVGERWDLFDVISTGSRSPNTNQRLGDLLQQSQVKCESYGKQAAQLLGTQNKGAKKIGDLWLKLKNEYTNQECIICADIALNEFGFVDDKINASVEERDFTTIVLGVPENKNAPGLMLVDSLSLAQVLSSSSTRGQPGIIAATDIGTTLFSFFDTNYRLGAGASIGIQSWEFWKYESVKDFVHRQVQVWEAQHRALKFLKFVPWVLAGLLLLAAWQRWIWLKYFALAYPLGLLVVPAIGVREGGIYLTAMLVAGGIAVFGERGIKGAAWSTILIVVIDVALGGWVSARTPLSYSPLEAARFYGIGNEIEGYLIGAALVAGAGDIVTTALLGVVVSVVLGAPMLGADFGGFLTSIVAFSVAILLQVKKVWRVWGGIALIALALLGTFLLIRSSAETHVGRAAAGGGEGRMTVMARKLSMNAHLTLTSPWALLALVQIILLWRQKKNPALLAGAGTVWGLNDSGIVAAALLLLWHEKAPGTAKVPGADSKKVA